MAVLNITYDGRSVDVPERVDDRSSDADIRRISVEVLRGTGFPGLAREALDNFVVDRLSGPGGVTRIYLRPKVPFGC